jgi:predicted nucleic acid-binding protein
MSAGELYLDSSALVKLYVREAETDDLAAFLRRRSPPLPFTALHELELTQALERRRAEGEVSMSEYKRVMAALEQDLTSGVLIRPVVEWPGVFARAVHLLKQHRGLRSLDALHIGHALESGAHWFVTYDRRQGKAASGEGLRLWPQD